MTLIICESLREIGEVACVTSAWSSRGQTLKFDRLFAAYFLLLIKISLVWDEGLGLEVRED